MAGKSIRVTTTVETPRSDIDPDFEKPILELSVSNPFKKILYWLNQIRKRQTTTLAFKLSIPLIAIPVIFAAAFSLGRISGLSLLKPFVQPSPSATSSPGTSAPQEITISKAGTLRIAKSAAKTTYLLALRNGELVSLEIPNTIDLTKYANKQILVTGTLDKNTNILKVTDIAEVTIYNSIKIPESTSSANL